MSRLPRQASEQIDRDRELRFKFDGRDVAAFEGDTIGSALYADGQRTFSRSFKYHRRRGLLCCSGDCANCLVSVDGAPGIRACTEPVRDGITVEHMNAYPSLDFDVMRATDLFGRPFTPPGFYYKTFIKPRRLWPLYEKVLRHAAGLGRLVKKQAERKWDTDYRRRHADVLVVGGGAAGLHAAIAAARLGADVVLADDGPRPGGQLLDEGRVEEAAALLAEATAAGVEILASGAALGYFDGLVPIWQGSTLHQVRAQAHVIATGTVEQPLVFPGNDLPGVMLARGARRLLARFSVLAGKRVVVATCDDDGLDAAKALEMAGAQIVAVADIREGEAVLKATGRKGVESVEIGPVDSNSPGNGRVRTVPCDLVVVSGGAMPATSLALQAGAHATVDERGHFAAAGLPAALHLAGAVDAAGAADILELSASCAGRAAALSLGLGTAEDAASLEQDEALLAAMRARPVSSGATPCCLGGGGTAFVCLCEDVTAKDIARAVGEGYDSAELAKRYTTVTMGPCQGRMCGRASSALIAAETGRDLDAIGQTTARPPWSSVPLGALAGRTFEPAKRSALHAKHKELGARIEWAGDWRRAYDYGDPAAEALAVHTDCGLIDVSTLGKLIVRGPDAGEMLDRLYPNRMSNLAVGRVRYGVLTSDAGRIMDDGTVCRLDDDEFYVTTTSSGAGAVEQWFTWWLADWDLDVSLTDVTQGIAAVNLAGPKCRGVLASLADFNCDPAAFEYLDGVQGTVADIPCLVLRIGFVGELGFEIHCPATHAHQLWNALMDAGVGSGVRAFGLEPQRILRLQKMHILVGQDTDSESTPYGAGMSWTVKLDKPQAFIGRWALEHASEQAPATTLVGFTMSNGTVPTEGSVVVVDGAAAGQVTSSRLSPQLDEVIGLAWVPSNLAGDGQSIEIADSGRLLSARVRRAPFFDPGGERLRS